MVLKTIYIGGLKKQEIIVESKLSKNNAVVKSQKQEEICSVSHAVKN